MAALRQAVGRSAERSAASAMNAVKIAPSAMTMAFFYVSSAAAYFAHAIFAYALIIFAQSRGGGASQSGQLLATMYGPMLVLGLYGGMLADRYSRKAILLTSHL